MAGMATSSLTMVAITETKATTIQGIPTTTLTVILNTTTITTTTIVVIIITITTITIRDITARPIIPTTKITMGAVTTGTITTRIPTKPQFLAHWPSHKKGGDELSGLHLFVKGIFWFPNGVW